MSKLAKDALKVLIVNKEIKLKPTNRGENIIESVHFDEGGGSIHFLQ